MLLRDGTSRVRAETQKYPNDIAALRGKILCLLGVKGLDSDYLLHFDFEPTISRSMTIDIS